MDTMMTLTGLVIELLGAYLLAKPGLRESLLRQFLGQNTTWPYALSVPLALVATGGATFGGIFFIKKGLRWIAWCLSLLVAGAWVPVMSRYAAEFLPRGFDEPFSDKHRNKLHLRGLLFLASGFVFQALGACL